MRILEFEGKRNVILRQLPLSKIRLIQHIKCACYQAGWVWSLWEDKFNLLIQIPGDGSHQDKYLPKWQQPSEFDITPF